MVDIFGISIELTMTLGNLIVIPGLVLTLVGLLLNFAQLRRNSRVQTAQFVITLTQELFSNKEMMILRSSLDYGDNILDLEGAFLGSEEEIMLDALLRRYDVLAGIVRNGVIDKSQLDVVMFEVGRVMNNVGVQKYIEHQDLQYKDYAGLNVRRPYDHLRWLSEGG